MQTIDILAEANKTRQTALAFNLTTVWQTQRNMARDVGGKANRNNKMQIKLYEK